MKKYLLFFILLILYTTLYADGTIIQNNGKLILLKDDFTWEYIKTDSPKADPLLEINYQGVNILVTDTRIIKTYSDKQEAGVRFKIKNNSDKTVTKLKVTVYFIDKNGKVFFEESYFPVNKDSWTDKTILKPNYSLKYPKDDNQYMTADGIVLEEWNEGKVIIEVAEIEVE